MRKVPRLFLIIVILTMALKAQAALAQVPDLKTSVEYTFNEQITFRAELNSEAPVQTALIFFQAAKDTHTGVGLASVTAVGETTYELVYTHKLSDYSIRPFSPVKYHYEITLLGGETYKSPEAEFYYMDNRQEWQTLEGKPFRVHWFEGEVAFAQTVLDVAQKGLTRVQNLMSMPAPAWLDIYIYPDAKWMQSAMTSSTANWVAGHAEPDLGVIVVALPEGPEQRLLAEQRIPHEVMHILLYQVTGPGYTNIPTWLGEGLASMAELYPNPDYRIVLENAAQNGNLLPMAALCQTFPRDASGALISYAQSASFVYYLKSTYGAPAMQELVNTYANGVECERGAEQTLGASLEQLERHWQRDELEQNVALSALNNLLPWLVLLGAVLLAPVGLILARGRGKARAVKRASE